MSLFNRHSKKTPLWNFPIKFASAFIIILSLLAPSYTYAQSLFAVPSNDTAHEALANLKCNKEVDVVTCNIAGFLSGDLSVKAFLIVATGALKSALVQFKIPLSFDAMARQYVVSKVKKELDNVISAVNGAGGANAPAFIRNLARHLGKLASGAAGDLINTINTAVQTCDFFHIPSLSGGGGGSGINLPNFSLPDWSQYLPQNIPGLLNKDYYKSSLLSSLGNLWPTGGANSLLKKFKDSITCTLPQKDGGLYYASYTQGGGAKTTREILENPLANSPAGVAIATTDQAALETRNKQMSEAATLNWAQGTKSSTDPTTGDITTPGSFVNALAQNSLTSQIDSLLATPGTNGFPVMNLSNVPGFATSKLHNL